jgi:hypothetical protein
VGGIDGGFHGEAPVKMDGVIVPSGTNLVGSRMRPDDHFCVLNEHSVRSEGPLPWPSYMPQG